MSISDIVLGALGGSAITLFIFNILSNRWIERESAKAFAVGFKVGSGIKSVSDDMLRNALKKNGDD